MAEEPSLPPSCKAVQLALRYRGPLTYTKLKRETNLADSTLTWALGECEQRGVVESHSHRYRPDEYEIADN